MKVLQEQIVRAPWSAERAHPPGKIREKKLSRNSKAGFCVVFFFNSTRRVVFPKNAMKKANLSCTILHSTVNYLFFWLDC